METNDQQYNAMQPCEVQRHVLNQWINSKITSVICFRCDVFIMQSGDVTYPLESHFIWKFELPISDIRNL